MRSFLLALGLVIGFCVKANDNKYPAAAISEELRKNANAVKRMETIEFRIINTGEAVLYRKYAITVLNENGDEHATFVEYYDKLRKINSIEGTLYDASGKELKQLKSKEIMDLSAVDDNNLMDDSRRKQHQFYYKSYPYTVEYEVEMKFNNTLFFPAWYPVEAEYFSVEQSSYSVICPSSYEVRYRAFNYKGELVTTNEGNKKSMKWEVKNAPGITRPYASPPWHQLTTVILFAPSEFEIENYRGNMSSWQEFGKFQYSLKKGKDELPANVLQTVQQLTAGITDEKQKVKILYEYLQKQTRYISIQLGLGGWQPFEASFVAQKGYGDCKALTNYMYSLLKAVNINSHYALVKAGSGQPIVEDFPSQQFNHVILCVPFSKDTMWLECTSQVLPAGYVSDFTANRKALLIDENGGTLVSTPRYTIKENTQIRKIRGKIDSEGFLNMKVNTVYSGIQQDHLSSMINSLSKDKVQKILQEELQLSTYTVNNFAYSENKTFIPELKEDLDITVSGYVTISGKRLFITPNILNRSSTKLETDEQRTVDLVFTKEWRDEDECEIEIPEGYQLEASPQRVSLKTKFGAYSSSAELKGNKIIYRRMREQYSGRFSAKDQAELAKFFADIYKSDRSRMVFVKKE